MRNNTSTIILSTFVTILFNITWLPAAVARDDDWSARYTSATIAHDVSSTPGTAAVPRGLSASLAWRPNLGAFDSVAVSSRGIPAAAVWKAAMPSAASKVAMTDCRSAACRTLKSGVLAALSEARDAALPLRLRLINSTVNRGLAYSSDAAVWGRSDYWARPEEILMRGRGDCEDYAILKYWLLRQAGVDDSQLQLVVVWHSYRKMFHAVLVVHDGDTRYVLDNLSPSVTADTAVRAYVPVMSFVGNKSYLHGYKSNRVDIADMPVELTAVAPGGPAFNSPR
jgi:predicted transglutaminase-like cysteine proteinase